MTSPCSAGAADLVAVGLARRRPLDIENRRVVAGDLQCLVPQAGGPLRHPRRVLNGACGPINCARKMPGPLIVFIPPPVKLVRLFLVVLEREKENQRDNRGGHRRDPPEGHQACGTLWPATRWLYSAPEICEPSSMPIP